MRNELIALCFAVMIIGTGSFLELRQQSMRIARVEVSLQNPHTVMAAEYDATAKIACTSDSMGLVVRCDDRVYGNTVNESTELEVGRIYVYSSSNGPIIHRLVYCLDSSCNETIFKGDNNYVAEKVNRAQILYSVDWVEYQGALS